MYVRQRITRSITALEGNMAIMPLEGTKPSLGVPVANPVRSILEFQFLAIWVSRSEMDLDIPELKPSRSMYSLKRQRVPHRPPEGV
jgi:hypothetical protein